MQLPPARSLSSHPSRRPAAALLEVVISVSILLLAMSVIGVAFRNGLDSVELADRISRGDQLTDNLLNAIDCGMVSISEAEQTGTFGEIAEEGMFWKTEAVPDPQVAGLIHGAIYIYRGDPDGPEQNRRLIATTYVERIVPKGIDFQRDFGFTQEQVESITSAVPGGEALFNPADFDPRSLAKLDMNMLIELLPTLIEAFGGAFLEGQMDKLLEAAQRGDIAGLQKIAEQAAQAQQGTQAGQEGASETPSPTIPSPFGSERPSETVRRRSSGGG